MGGLSMHKRLWQSPEQLENLLYELVGWDSHTLSEGERTFPEKLERKLLHLDYFYTKPELISLQPVDFGRKLLTALYKHPEAVKTIVLLSHYDTVETKEYGTLEPLAVDPEALTARLFEEVHTLPGAAREDLVSGQYVFGRGTMDMKAGLMLHMKLLEQAIEESWPLNLVLLTVPDEEVNSSGMRAAVPELLRLREEHSLSYSLFLNSEPSFTQEPGDETHYIYTGTMGKIMPAALFYGKETHVGEPLSGITANYMASFLTQAMEWNTSFREEHFNETTPLPVSLHQKDLKAEYSTQTPYRSIALYNVFLMRQNASDIMNLFEETAESAVNTCNASYRKLCEQEKIEGVGNIQTLRYEKLLIYAEQKLGSEKVEQLKNNVYTRHEWDDREKSFGLADELMIHCPELAPAVVLLYAPPYYPAVNTSEDPVAKDLIHQAQNIAHSQQIDLKHAHYFNGICDLSYVQYTDDGTEFETYKKNTPVWGSTYTIPFDEMKMLQAPVLNIGPFGKDPHQRMERLHIHNAFVHTPAMLERVLKRLFEPLYETQSE